MTRCNPWALVCQWLILAKWGWGEICIFKKEMGIKVRRLLCLFFFFFVNHGGVVIARTFHIFICLEEDRNGWIG